MLIPRAKQIAQKSPKKLKAYVEEHLPLIVEFEANPSHQLPPA
jgi:hypothetical protein